VSSAYVAVRTRYYKQKTAIAILDHAYALRNGFTNSINVIQDLTQDNRGFYFNGSTSSLDAFNSACDKYREVTGKKCRSDFNALFEHVLVFTASRYDELEQKYGAEKVKAAMLLQMQKYAIEISKQFGFEPLGIDLHLDEGTIYPQTGDVKRNVHAHIQFFNYDFQNKVAPLRHLMRKGLNNKGQTNELNPNFVMMQDIAGKLFTKAGFSRGHSKSITSKEHLEKEQFVKQKLQTMEQEISALQALSIELATAIKKRAKSALIKVNRAAGLVLNRVRSNRI
jgi:hypothetical protein